MKDTLKIGDKVIWHTGFYGNEHGRSGRDFWYTIDRECIIIDADIDRYLLELADKSRQWARKGEVEDFNLFEFNKAASEKEARITEENILPVQKSKWVSTTGSPTKFKIRIP